MKDVGTDDTAGNKSDFGGPIKEASSTSDEEDDNLIYDRERFMRNKARTITTSTTWTVGSSSSEEWLCQTLMTEHQGYGQFWMPRGGQRW